MKTEPFKNIHTDLHNLCIPLKIFTPFAERKMSRVKVLIKYDKNSINFYAAVKKDKNSGNYKMMFSKAKQKELGLSLGDEFEIQLFEDTSKYGVDMPEELEAVLLSDPIAFDIFESLTKGKQRSIIYYIKKLPKSQKKIDKSLLLCENLIRGNTENKELFKPIEGFL